MTRLTLGLVGLFLFAASLIGVLGIPAPFPSTSSQAAQQTAVTLDSCVVKVIYDGDTLGCDMDGNGKVTGKQEHVRLLGIDAPEMHYSRKNHSGKNQPYAKAAVDWVTQTALNRRVYLEFDRERTDKYNRLLAYVYLDPAQKTMLNAVLLEKGLAKVLFIRVNRRYERYFNHLQQQARARRQNLWQAAQVD